MGLALVLLPLGLIIAIGLPIVGVGYLAVRDHFHDIPVRRSTAVGMSSLVAAGLGSAWLTLSLFGLALGQSLGNASLGSLLGGLLGMVGWVTTAIVYGWRITRRLAELQVMIGASAQPPVADRGRMRLRVGLGTISS